MSNTNTQSGVGLLGILGIAFIMLKLTEAIDWSWWWVTLPLWGSFALFSSFFLIAFLIAGIKMIWERVSVFFHVNWSNLKTKIAKRLK